MKIKAKKFYYCSHCGLKFKRDTKNQTVCNSCKFERKNKQEFWNYESVCKICGKVFKARAITEKYCSSKCALKASLEYKTNTSVMKIRFEVFKRDGFKCTYCGRGVKDGVILEIDHKIPKSKNGDNLTENYRTSCKECNIGKGDCLLEHKRIPKKMKIGNRLE